MGDFDRFKEFILQSSAKHGAEMGEMREQMRETQQILRGVSTDLDRITSTLQIVVDNQIHAQERGDRLQESVDKLAVRDDEIAKRHEAIAARHEEIAVRHAELAASLQELRHIVFRHATDPNAHHL